MRRMLIIAAGVSWAAGMTGCAQWMSPWAAKKKAASGAGDASAKVTRTATPLADTDSAELRNVEAVEQWQPGEAGDGTDQEVRRYLAALDEIGRDAEPSRDVTPRQPRSPVPEPLPGEFTDGNAAWTNASAELRQPVQPAARRAAPAQAAPVLVSASLASDSLAVPASDSPALGVHRGMDTLVPPDRADLERLIEVAKANLADDPSNAEKQLRLSLLQLSAGRPGEARDLSPALPEESRALISRLIDTVSSGSRLLGEPLATSEEALGAVEELRAMLRSEAELMIPVVALCSRVVTFGVYDPLPPEALQPYRANRAIVYCEIENFRSEKLDDGRYHSVLAARLELFTGGGRSLWVREEDRVEDISHQRREDFFLTQMVTLPANLEPGEYVLKVTLTDLLASKTNQAAHRFAIPGAASNALAPR